ncbi:MAG: DinB family protein [Bacteroidetes bacterium]|nr:DinB family protein [Bacteroidota bacterium]MBK9798603.1 DinB family protein [Bacteroidota bacterium]
MKIPAIVKQYDFNLAYAKALVHDVPELLMTHTPATGLENHPAFTLGHLLSGSALLAEDLGLEMNLPQAWVSLFVRNGPGDPRIPELDVELYPTKLELLTALESQHNRVKQKLSELNEEQLQAPFKWRFSNYFPSVYDLIVFMCINHESMHLGQLAAWRRAMKLPSALALL